VSLAEHQTEATPADLEALEEAFAFFSRQTEQLKEAYLHLKAETARINTELDQANLELERKVRELDEANGFRHSILESIPAAVVVTDLSGRVNTFNAAAEGLWHMPRREAIGRDYREVMGRHAALMREVLAEHRRGEETWRGEDEERVRIVSSTADVVRNAEGRPLGAVRVDRDVTDIWSLENRLNHHAKLADVGKMAAGLVHEIRKPLNGIKGFASLLDRKLSDGPAGRRYVNNIIGAADRLNEMLGQLLDFARPDALHSAPCDLRALVGQIAEFVRAESPDCPIAIEVDIADDARMVSCDANKIQQVLLNLVKNAAEALGESGTCVCIGARRESGGDGLVRVDVIDDGIGIAPEDLTKVTEPFYTAKSGGVGLGLSIVNRILQLHGTELDVESRVGNGTKMGFMLPAAPKRERA